MDEFKKLLAEFVALKSVSTDPAYASEIGKCVNWLKQLLIGGGLKVEIWRGKTGNLVIYASYKNLEPRAQNLETILVYGHYDVQPADKIDGWKADPFVLRKTKDRLIGRGVIDDKGQILIHIYSVLKLIKEKKLQHNVIFLIEGDEETAGGDLTGLMRKNKSKLRADTAIVSDGEIVSDIPVIEASLRGGFNLTLTYKTADNNLHSGTFGNAAPNAAHELSKFLAKLYDRNNRVSVPGFYDGADKIRPEQLKNNRRVAAISQKMLKNTGIKKFLLEEGLDFCTQTGLRPALQVTGLKSGYISAGYANIVPAVAEARINVRLVASQEPKSVFAGLEKFIKANTPRYVDYEISVSGFHYPVKVDISSEKVTHVRRLLKSSHGKEPLTKHVGGAIPVVGDFKEILGLETILVPLCNDDCNMHGAEENFRISHLKKGLDFSRRFFSE